MNSVANCSLWQFSYLQGTEAYCVATCTACYHTADWRTHFVGAESLFEMRVLEEPCDRQHIGAAVHQHEEERSGQVEPRHRRVVLHHEVE